MNYKFYKAKAILMKNKNNKMTIRLIFKKIILK
jgi:hypothetical protein